MSRASALSRLLLGAAHITSRSLASQAAAPAQGYAARVLANCLNTQTSHFHTSWRPWAEAPTKAPGSAVTGAGGEDALSHLMDKDEWDEAWAYEPRFGTVESPIKVPSLMDERIMGVTDPEDDTLVIWGIIRADEPPKQLVAGGEFFVLEKVERIPRVRDLLHGDQLEH